MLPVIALAVMAAVPLIHAGPVKATNLYKSVVGSSDYIPENLRKGYKIATRELTSGDNRGYDDLIGRALALAQSLVGVSDLMGAFLARADFNNMCSVALEDQEKGLTDEEKKQVEIHQALFNGSQILRAGYSDSVPGKLCCAFSSEKGTSYRDIAAIAKGYFKEFEQTVISGADHCPALYGIKPIDIVTVPVTVKKSMTTNDTKGKQQTLTAISIGPITVNQIPDASRYQNAILGQAFMIGAIFGRLERNYVYSEGGSNLDKAIDQLTITGVDEPLKTQVKEAIIKGYKDNRKPQRDYASLWSQAAMAEAEAKKPAEGASGGSAASSRPASPRGSSS